MLPINNSNNYNDSNDELRVSVDLLREEASQKVDELISIIKEKKIKPKVDKCSISSIRELIGSLFHHKIETDRIKKRIDSEDTDMDSEKEYDQNEDGDQFGRMGVAG